MAYDGYQNSSNPYSQMGHANQIDPNEYRPTSYTPPYPSQYGSDRLNMPQPSVPPMSSSPTNQYHHPYQDPNMWQQQQQPPPPPPSQPPHTGRINDAVNSAFNNQADNSNYLPPEVLSQITATVIQQLKETGLNNLQGDQQSSYPPPRPPKPWSPAATNSVPSEAPPSPSLGIHNPSPTPTPNPAHEGTNFPPPPSAGYSGAPRFHRPSPAPVERRDSPASQTSDYSHRMESRPKIPPREEDATVTELTTLEKIWGKLFENGKPTERLGQFLRGIAVHLIEAYPPENTLVITPEKMQKFYEDTKVSADPYPWHDIFDDRTSSISRLFREVEAEHHLVQNKLNERPDIPGLTPRGFERWATLMIRAHPEKEYERLKKAVLNMPISNPDNKKERFPKEIPRRLFPETPVLPLREEVDQFIIKHCGVDLPPITDEEVKQAAAHRHKPSTSSSASGTESASVSERERKPKQYQASVSAVVDDDDEDKEIPPQPIERQRKPYTAQPGGGKNYEEKKTSGHRHTQSFSGGSIPKESLGGHGHKQSDAYGQDPLYSRGASRPFGGRSRSPSRVNASDYRHSESDLLQSNSGLYGTSPGGHYGSGAGTLTGDILEDNRRRRELEREDEDLRLYESLREREKEREKSKYNDHFPARSSWSNDEDFYRGMLGGQGGGPVGGSSGYDYKSYGFK